MFIGQHSLPLDEQRQLTLPAGFLAMLRGGAFVTRGFDRNLVFMSRTEFGELVNRIQGINIADPNARLLLRLILGSASELEVGENGEVTIPQLLQDFVDAQGSVVLVGQGNYLELWSADSWKQQELHLQDPDANADRFAGLRLAFG